MKDQIIRFFAALRKQDYRAPDSHGTAEGASEAMTMWTVFANKAGTPEEFRACAAAWMASDAKGYWPKPGMVISAMRSADVLPIEDGMTEEERAKEWKERQDARQGFGARIEEGERREQEQESRLLGDTVRTPSQKSTLAMRYHQRKGMK